MYRNYEQVRLDELVAYIRKSRTDDPSLTLEEVLQKQEFELREYAERVFGGWLPESRIYREVASSETIDDRPEMCRILKAIESPNIRGVYVREIERLSRGDAYEVGLLLRAFRFSNTLIVTPSEVYDVRNESDRMIVEMKLKYGNQYLEYSVKNMKRGKDLASMNGEFIAKTSPYGYQKITYREGSRNVKTLEIVPEKAEIIRLIFDSYVNKGMSMHSIENMLNELKIKAPLKDRWNKFTIADMLINPVYMGKIRWNYRTNVRSWEDRQTVVSRPRKSLDECILVDGKHEAIISEELFWSAYNRKSKNAPIKKSTELKNPFAGIFYCAKCGKAMKFRQGDPRNVPRFECTNMKYCGNGSVTYDDLMKSVCDALLQHIGDFEVIVNNDNSDAVDSHKKKIEALEKRLAEVEKKEVSIWDKYTEEGMPKNIFDKLMESVVNDKKELKESLANAYETMPTQKDYKEVTKTFKEALEKVQSNDVSAQIKNTYLRRIIKKMTFEREKSVLLTKELAKEMGVPYTHPLCHHNYPFSIEMDLQD